MFRTLVVVADSGRARIYGWEGKGKPMLELADLIHTEARMREHEIHSDRPGRTFDSKGSGRHAMESSSPLKMQKETKFAGQIVDYINVERNRHNFSDLVLIAAPGFLGELRKSLDRETGKLVTRQIDKNLVLQQESVIRKYLAA